MKSLLLQSLHYISYLQHIAKYKTTSEKVSEITSTGIKEIANRKHLTCDCYDSYQLKPYALTLTHAQNLGRSITTNY